MDHFISYDLARGLHIIAVIAWLAGLLMLPRLYAGISALPADDAARQILIKSTQQIRTIILAPFMVLAWALGIFLFGTYFATDWDDPVARALAAPSWFWIKVALALSLTAYHGFLVSAGRRMAHREQAYSERFWHVMSVLPFLVAMAVVLLATLEPGNSDLAF